MLFSLYHVYVRILSYITVVFTEHCDRSSSTICVWVPCCTFIYSFIFLSVCVFYHCGLLSEIHMNDDNMLYCNTVLCRTCLNLTIVHSYINILLFTRPRLGLILIVVICKSLFNAEWHKGAPYSTKNVDILLNVWIELKKWLNDVVFGRYFRSSAWRHSAPMCTWGSWHGDTALKVLISRQ